LNFPERGGETVCGAFGVLADLHHDRAGRISAVDFVLPGFVDLAEQGRPADHGLAGPFRTGK